MQIVKPRKARCLHSGLLVCLAMAGPPPASGRSAPDQPVSLQQTDTVFTLANAFVTARIDRRSGDLVSLSYRGVEVLGSGSGHPFAYWSHSPARSPHLSSMPTIDPARNGGERAEVSVKGSYGGEPLGEGPGGSVAADIEIRYTLGREDSGLYTCCIFTHRPGYPATSIGEARFGAKLNDAIFDYMTVDSRRRKLMITAEDWKKGSPLNMKEARRMTTGLYRGQVEHKYDYSAVQFDTPAFGWSSTQRHLGFWFINPTIEYLSGGPTKVELTAHRDVNEGAAPTLLNYWRGSHYGGSFCTLARDEAWTKVIGPFLLYCNTAPTHEALWKDALAQAGREAAQWPYRWVDGVDYPHKEARGAVRGQISLHDTGAPKARMKNLLVGLTARDDQPVSRRGRDADPIDWQRDAKHYQFWTRADSQGRFQILHARPGVYTLHAIADGVLGEYARAGVTVEPGKIVDLGRIAWKPMRYGPTLWEIGVPDRAAGEFRHGDHYWQWGLYNAYSEEFPDDVRFLVGKSDCRKDWNYAQLPRGNGEGSTWTVRFRLSEPLRSRAVLRLAFAGTSARTVQVAVNDQAAGDTGPLPDTAVIRRDGIRGYWFERDVFCDGALFKVGENTLKLTIPPGGAMSGVMYDYIRLEQVSGP